MKSVVQHFWSKGLPCKCPERECVTLQSNIDGTLTWKMESCNNPNIFICKSNQQGKRNSKENN